MSTLPVRPGHRDWERSIHAYLSALVDTGTYTPTLSGMAIGTGGSATNTAHYTYVAGLLFVDGRIVFGTSGTTFPGATITVSLPPGYEIADGAQLVTTNLGGVVYEDADNTDYMGHLRYASTTTMRLVVEGATLTNVSIGGTGTTTPFTWVAGDGITWDAQLRAVAV